MNKVPNNKYPNCPALMNDGRLFTDYRSHDYVNNIYRMSSGTVSSYDYRQYLINNANDIMKNNREHAQQMSNCSPCTAQPVPFLRECDSNLTSTECKMLNPNGIGTKYGSNMH